ncbi:activation-associated secreted protein-1 [Aphelenchoides avenae]|nr:activation-associated secreted protein-1 [Aphelenchus avenae]
MESANIALKNASNCSAHAITRSTLPETQLFIAPPDKDFCFRSPLCITAYARQYTADLSEEHRTLVVEKQNSFRSQLALSQAVNKDGKTLTNAANIIKLKYNTKLEWYGRRWASKCRPNYRFKDVDNLLGNIYFHQAGKLERERALRNVAGGSLALLKARGIDRNKLSVNVGSDMKSWAQMMWHNAREVGCGVYYCKGINQTLANCVYDR